jgi:uncharacterized protein YwqG
MSANEANATEPSVLQLRERFEAHIYDIFAREIQSWDAATCEDIYAISFFIYDNANDPRQPQVHLCYNTLGEWKRSIRSGGEDPDESKWNFVDWSMDFKAIIPTFYRKDESMIPDIEGEALRDAWLASENFGDPHDDFDSATPPVTQAFVDMCIRVARRLHDNGVIHGAFGRTVPIIVQTDEIWDDILEETISANPPGAADEFVNYHKNIWKGIVKPSIYSFGFSSREEAAEAIRNSAFSAQAELLATFLRPSARLFICNKDGSERIDGARLTVSRFGGLPTLPENVAWPTWNKTEHILNKIAVLERIFEKNRQKDGDSSEDLGQRIQEKIAKKREELLAGEVPLAFLGQLSLREIQSVAPLPGWPIEGILAFFYDPEKIWGISPENRGHCRILFFPEDVTLRQVLNYPESLGKEGRYPERALTIRCEWTLEKYLNFKKDQTKLREKLGFLELLEKLNADGPNAIGSVHRCGGYAQEIRHPLRDQCQFVTNGIKWGDISSASKHPRAAELKKGVMDWQLVMQFDSQRSLDWKWGKGGRVYFMARRQDIEAGDFSNCWAILQCD